MAKYDWSTSRNYVAFLAGELAPGTRYPYHDSESSTCYHDAFLPWGHYHNNIVLFYHDSPITRSHFMDPTDRAIQGFYCIVFDLNVSLTSRMQRSLLLCLTFMYLWPPECRHPCGGWTRDKCPEFVPRGRPLAARVHPGHRGILYLLPGTRCEDRDTHGRQTGGNQDTRIYRVLNSWKSQHYVMVIFGVKGHVNPSRAKPEYFGRTCQYHSCWCPGCLRY